MKINKQLFEDVLSGKLKGIFVLKNGFTARSNRLFYTGHNYYLYALKGFSCSFSCEGNTLNIGYDIIDFIPDTDMKKNELTIEIPDGKEIDWEESKERNKIVLKDKQLTYEDVCKKLFKDRVYFITSSGEIDSVTTDTLCIADPNNAATKHQLECIFAKNMLANTAKYLNDGWRPNFSDKLRVFVIYNGDDNILRIDYENSLHARSLGYIIFKSKKRAKQAIEILGEETVKLALEPLGI